MSINRLIAEGRPARQKIAEAVLAHNAVNLVEGGNNIIYTPGEFVSAMFQVEMKNTCLLEFLLRVMNVPEIVEAEACVTAALADDDEGHAYYSACMKLGEIMVVAAQSRIKLDLQSRVRGMVL
jgi:hypothetical protein